MADEPGQPPALTGLSLAEAAPENPPSLASKAIAQLITPFDVSGGKDESGKELAIDYEKLTRDFGATPISPALLDRFEKVTGKKPHRFMRRGIVLSHRDLDKILDRYEKGQPFYLYTGRGPSSDSMHVGHSIPFEFTKYLQDVFDCPLVIMLTDDEKFMHTPKLDIEDVEKFTKKNCEDIIAIGFDPAKTFIFSDIEYIGSSQAFYKNIIRMAKRTTINSVRGTFGFTAENNVGEYHFPAIQSATSFATSFPHIFGTDPLKARSIPCLIPCAIDQDPYFRQCREHAEKLKYKKPSIIHSTFLPSLAGPGSKMSASNLASAVYLTDTPNQIKKKVNSAFSGGQDNVELHRKLGGRTKDDVPYQYLTFFMEDDAELEEIRTKYEAGEMLTGEIKAICTKYVQEYVAGFQARRKEVNEQKRQEFMSIRSLTYGGNPNPMKVEEKEKKVPAGEKAASKPKVKAEAEGDARANGQATTTAPGHKKKKSISSTERRAQLTREVEGLRAALEAKEKELKELS
jgi:tryptophanyl-tRNA synthetase